MIRENSLSTLFYSIEKKKGKRISSEERENERFRWVVDILFDLNLFLLLI